MSTRFVQSLRRWTAMSLLAMAAAALTTGHGWAAEKDEVQRASRAYERGTTAHARGDYAEAARAFAEADELTPNNVALRAALEAATLADDPALGMTLVERAETRPKGEALNQAVRAARAKFATRAGKLRVVCLAQPACTAKVDGKPFEPNVSTFVRAGEHLIEGTVGTRSISRKVSVPGGGKLDVPFEKPESAATPSSPASPASPPPTPTPSPSSPEPRPETKPAPTAQGGVDPVWFWVGAGATALLAGGTVWSGLDATSKHDDFTKSGCSQVGSDACDSAANDGRDAQLRTNILIGVSAAAAIGTAALGVFAVRWKDPEADTSYALGVSPTGVVTLVAPF